MCFDCERANCNGTCWPPYYIGEHLHIISSAGEDDEELCKKPNEGNFQRVTACAELFKQIGYSSHSQKSHVKIFIELLSYVIPPQKRALGILKSRAHYYSQNTYQNQNWWRCSKSSGAVPSFKL